MDGFVPDLAALEIDSAMETSSSEEEEEEGRGTANVGGSAGFRAAEDAAAAAAASATVRSGLRRRATTRLRASRATLGWDAAPARAPPCGAFTSRGARRSAARTRAGAWHSKAAESALFGEPAPAGRRWTRLCTRRERRSSSPAARRRAPRARLFAGSRDRDERSARRRLPPPRRERRGPAGALAPLAEATRRRAALEAALERGAASQGPQFLLPKRNEATAVNTSSSRTTGDAKKPEKFVPPDLATQSARREACDMLRALDAATLALPAAAARRDAERLCAARMTEAYHARGAFDGKDAAAGPDSGGVTLLEALAHTRSIRARVAALADLFGGDPLDARSSSSSSSSSSGAALLRRTARRLAFAGAGERDGSVDWTLRRVAAAAAAPVLAQMRAWTRGARPRPPRRFPVATSPDWGRAPRRSSGPPRNEPSEASEGGPNALKTRA